MIEGFIEEYAKLIVSHPEDISSVVNETNELYEITLYANGDDLGKLIGKGGQMISAIKNIISGCKAKNGKNYKINVTEKS
ncbi:putative RNA-binding protein (contains KH domain) [Thiovulum sp. ES]|nr:putative RNA-binding protein (contains KH domain) [Thiovulum sp. ES]